jgi:xanthine dehydrogenase accessory factor
MTADTGRRGSERSPGAYAVILGANEVASAAAVALLRAGWRVVLAHDRNPPVVRRGMAFHDALFGDPAVLAEVGAARADGAIDVVKAMNRGPGVVVTPMGLLDLIVLDKLDLLIDARLQPAGASPDLRWLARLSIGLGPAFAGGVNCDIAIGAADIGPARPADVRAKRSLYAPHHGVWRTPVEIGAHIYKDFVLGHLDADAIRSPIDGVIIGAVRDGTEVPAGAEVAEIDGRIRKARWSGLDDRGRAFAAAILLAIRTSRRRTESGRAHASSQTRPGA